MTTCHCIFSGTSEECGILSAGSVSATANRTFNNTVNQINLNEAKPKCKGQFTLATMLACS